MKKSSHVNRNGKNGSKIRLDMLLVQRSLADTRTKAAALIGAGLVLVNNRPSDKAGQKFPEDVDIRVKGDNCPYCSRGGLKLEKAIDEFGIEVGGKICMDAGASTGGFTDCLLQHGAKKVYAVDVGYGQLAWKLRNDSRVIVMERTNIRYLERDAIYEEMDIVTVDTSFISLKLVTPPLIQFMHPGSLMVTLVKPQFEAGRDRIGKGGIVRDPETRKEVLDDLMDFFSASQDLEVHGYVESPIRGAKGNIEFLMLLEKK